MRPQESFPTSQFVGLNFCSLSALEIIALVLDDVHRQGGGLDIHLLNASSVYYSEIDPKVREMYASGMLLLADGKPIHLFARLQGLKIPQTRGPSLFRELLSEGRQKHVRHFFLGTTDETLNLLTANISKQFPGVVVAGSLSPSFGDPDNQELARRDDAIRSAQPDIVWIGMSSPRQDVEAIRIARKFGCVTIAVGAAFDFVAGTQKEAPLILQKSGLEWLFRLFTNPRRLWKRYLVGNFCFLWVVFLYAVGLRKSN